MCVVPKVASDDHNGKKHNFLLRILNDDPHEFCVERARGGECPEEENDTDDHTRSHGGSAHFMP